MSRSHNKKRNVGIIYEQIVLFICNKLLEENKKEAELATNIIAKHFKKNTQLYKEHKLFKALINTNNVSDQLASSIISEAKKACNNMFDSKKLEQEKSLLIKDLNYCFGKGRIFEEKITDYRMFATIQTLLNEWRDIDGNFEKTTEYEIKLHNRLTENKKEDRPNIPIKVDPLTYRIMNKKFNEKYNSVLNESQQKLISNFIKDDADLISENYKALKESCIKKLDSYIRTCNNNILIEKNQNIRLKISNLDSNDLTKENLQKFLIVAKLKEELVGE